MDHADLNAGELYKEFYRLFISRGRVVWLLFGVPGIWIGRRLLCVGWWFHAFWHIFYIQGEKRHEKTYTQLHQTFNFCQKGHVVSNNNFCLGAITHYAGNNQKLAFNAQGAMNSRLNILKLESEFSFWTSFLPIWAFPIGSLACRSEKLFLCKRCNMYAPKV